MNEPTPEDAPIRLVLLDIYGLFRTSLGKFLASEPGFELAGEFGTSAEALKALRRSRVDVILLDFDLGAEHGNEFIPAAREAGYQGRFLIVASTADARNSALALKLGASGVFLKADGLSRLVQAIRMVANGGVWVDPKVVLLIAHEFTSASSPQEGMLEERERRVLLGILGGLTNRKIGDGMGLSESSVKAVIQRLFAKAGVRSRSQLVRVALEGSLRTQRFLKTGPCWRTDQAANLPVKIH